MSSSGFKLNDLWLRLITGLVLAAAAAGAIWFGGPVYAAFVVAAAVLVLREWANLTGLKPRLYLLSLAVLACAVALAFVDVRIDGLFKAAGVIGAGAIVLILFGGPAAAGVAYAGLPAVALLWLRALPWGFELVVWIMAVVIATDVFAYFTGRLIGGRKLAPKISPGKTWAGLIGGVVAALIIGWLVARHFDLPVWLGFAGGIMAVLAQAGDLFESWLKRRVGAKDSGTLLPGHGGVMDRVDGLLPVALATAVAVLVGMGVW